VRELRLNSSKARISVLQEIIVYSIDVREIYSKALIIKHCVWLEYAGTLSPCYRLNLHLDEFKIILMGVVIPYRGMMPRMGKEVYIAPTATLIGDVTLGDFSSVWFGAVLRGDVENIVVGECTNIQDNAVVHGTLGKFNVEIGSYVTIGHGACVHASKIASHVVVGIGAILLDGVEVGEYSIIGAGALIPPGMKIEPGSIVLGIPGKVVRKITDKDREMIERDWKNYLEYAREYLRDEK